MQRGLTGCDYVYNFSSKTILVEINDNIEFSLF